MAAQDQDASVLGRIQDLAAEEHALFARASFGDVDRKRVAVVQAELDQCWDLLRQRRALRKYGQDAARARVRAPDLVKRYLG